MRSPWGNNIMKEIEITREPVELYKILKFENIVSSGGEAKTVIDEGQVMVNLKDPLIFLVSNNSQCAGI